MKVSSISFRDKQIAKVKNKLKAEKNEVFAKSQTPLIKSSWQMMNGFECSCEGAMKDPEFADTNVDEKTIV